MKILGILQCQWFKEPDRVRDYLARHPGHDSRARYTKRALFYGGHSGKMLMMNLGEKLCWDVMTWGEASPEIGGHASACFKPDPDYVASLIEHFRPDMVVSFGNVAHEAAAEVTIARGLCYVRSVHPAMRGDAGKALRVTREAIEAFQMLANL